MKVLVARPSYGFVHWGMELAGIEISKAIPEADIACRNGSFLTHQFNQLWCLALNDKRYTHFVMLHSDIAMHRPRDLKKLIALCDEKHADVMSVVSPIKMELGTTSTGLAKGGRIRRLTLKEIYQLPETFNRADAEKLLGYADSQFIVNTGLMVVALTQKNRPVLETMLFRVNNQIKRDGNLKYYAVSEPEDWEWSRQAQEKGLSVWATRAIALDHIGEKYYGNNSAWGTLDHDQEEEG